jgi:hypothetical protein
VPHDGSRPTTVSPGHAQQSALAAAGTAEQTEEFALVDIQRYPVDGIGRVEYLGDVLDVYEGFGRGIAPGFWGAFTNLDWVILGVFTVSRDDACPGPLRDQGQAGLQDSGG